MPTKARIRYLKKNYKLNQEIKEKKQKKYILAGIKEYPVNREIGLLDFLFTIMKDQSRNNVKSILAKRCVAVNGLPVTQFDYMLYKGDIIQISKTPLEMTAEEKKKKDLKKKTDTREILDIIYENEDFLVINKPAGLLSIESDTEKNQTAYKMVLKYMQRKDPHARCFQVHRIDKETSGVLLFTKSFELNEMMKKRWNQLVIERGYVALVEGVMENKKDTIIEYLKKSDTTLMYATNDKINGQKAVTHYEVEKESAYFSLLKVKIDSGRKNQIRVALANIGHPIVGDEKYGQVKTPIKRLGLHAGTLIIKHPVSGKVYTFKVETPTEFYRVFS